MLMTIKASRNEKMFVTESTSFVSTRGEYEINKEKGYVSNIGPYTSDWGPEPGKDWEQIVLYPYLGGTFVWTGFDYRGEPTPYLWPCVSSHFGIMDICGFPKRRILCISGCVDQYTHCAFIPALELAGERREPH